MTTEPRYADVVAGVQAALSAYVHALDDGRAADVVATFCPDGVIEIPGMGTLTGRAELLEGYTKWAPRRPQRHLVLNTHVSEWNATEASATSDVVFLALGKTGWAVQLVGRYQDRLRCDEGVWKFRHRFASFVTPDPPPADQGDR
jgi:hypothetical protein